MVKMGLTAEKDLDVMILNIIQQKRNPRRKKNKPGTGVGQLSDAEYDGKSSSTIQYITHVHVPTCIYS